MWWKLVILVLIGILTLKTIYMSYLGKFFESLTKKIQGFQKLKISDDSGRSEL